ncbi:porin family protein [Sphingosinicella sp. LY1275]|uniref:outer membrane protein n=1 Tax=Sphingosinicella sp. LY1275 TaxID=3095379 RepID=UPI002ADEF853|nr:porin family protein [Sphingosinicella sp. LY1275]MEA1013022.1 porin family protein [Sphingosinicella sp. LY1275]
MKRIALAAVAATVIAAPAFAAPSGPRIEGIVGYDHAQVDFTDIGGSDEDAGGVVYGVGIGYDFAVGTNGAFGIDAEITDSTADLKFVDGTDSAKIAVNRDLYVGGRYTAAVNDKVNLYAKLGYTNARIKGSVTTGGTTVSDSANADGVRAGLGAQFAIGPNSFVGTEYRYSNYEGDFSRHQAVATFGFRF